MHSKQTLCPGFPAPQMNMPTPNQSAQAAGNFWGGFGSMMDNNPNAWKYLAQAPAGALQTRCWSKTSDEGRQAFKIVRSNQMSQPIRNMAAAAN